MFKKLFILLSFTLLAECISFGQSRSENLREPKNPFGRKREKTKTRGKVFQKRSKTKQSGDISGFLNHRTRVSNNFFRRLAFWKSNKNNKAKTNNFSYGKLKRSEMRGLFKRERTSGKWFKERTLKKLNRNRNRYRRRYGY
jgi:hypothetical protein